MSVARHDCWRTFEFTLAGDVGPVLRSAFAGLEFESVGAGTTLGFGDDRGLDLVDVIALLSAARLTIHEVRVVPQRSPTCTSPATGEVSSGRTPVAWKRRGTPG